MITEFSIRNFFSIKSVQKIGFEPSTDTYIPDEYSYKVKDGARLLKVGITYGANVSDKTNILDAIGFFRVLALRMPKDKTEKTRAVPLMLDDASRNKKTGTSVVFYTNQSKYALSFELDTRHIYSEILIVYDSTRLIKLYNRSYDAAIDSTIIDFDVSLKVTKKNQNVVSGNTISNCSVPAVSGKSSMERIRLNDVYDYFVKQVKDVLAPGMLFLGYVKLRLDKGEAGDLREFILSLLKASDSNIEDVVLHEEEELITPGLEQLIQNAPTDKNAKVETLRKGKITSTGLTFRHKAGDKVYDLSGGYESNGTMRFLGMAVILSFLLKTNRLVPTDEVETSIHYELLAYFLKVLLADSNGTSQVLLTTYDTDPLNGDFTCHDTIWFTNKDELGEIKIVCLSSLGLHKNPSLYNAYKQGKLVELPFLGSRYINLDD